MKKYVWIIGLVFMVCTTAWAADHTPKIVVQGKAVEMVIPDEMIWSVTVTSRGDQIQALAQDHSQSVNQVLSFLETARILKEDTQTTGMRFGENWTHQSGKRILEGVVATTQVGFKLKDFDKYQKLWTGLSQIEGASIQNIAYGYSGMEALEEKIQLAALTHARKKAQAMAQTLDAQLGGVVLIEEDPGFLAPRNGVLMAGDAGFRSGGQEAGGFALGKLRVSSQVKVVFALEQR